MHEEPEISEESVIKKSLFQVATGAGLILIGTLISIIFLFISRVIIARYWSASEYGIFSLAVSIFSIFTTISTLGLKQGVTRNIAFNRGKNETNKIRNYISFSIIISLAASVTIGVILFLFSETIAVDLFNDQTLIYPLRIMSIGIPFYTIIDMSISIFRGYNNIKPMIYFLDITLNVLFTLFIVFIIVIKLPFNFVFFAYVASLVFTLFFLSIYSVKNRTGRIINRKSLMTRDAKELLIFSLPLLGSAMLHMTIKWTDTIMLGAIKNTVDVGLYNVAHNIANFIQFPLSAIVLIYLPVLSGLYARKRKNEIIRIYKITSKWITSISLPLFLFIFLFSNVTIVYMFGYEYIAGINVLKIFSFAVFFNILMGPCGITLLAMGESKFILYTTFATAVVNIILNFILIPEYGIIGAAIASAISLITINAAKVLKIYQLGKIQPFSRNLLKPLTLSSILLVSFYVVLFNGKFISFLQTVLIFFGFYAVYLVVFLSTKSMDEEDLNLIEMIGKSIGKSTYKLRKFLSRFV